MEHYENSFTKWRLSFFQDELWTTFTILAVVIGAVDIDILAAKFRLTCSSLRLLLIGKQRKPLLSDSENEVDASENTLHKSDDGRGFENVPSASQRSRSSKFSLAAGFVSETFLSRIHLSSRFARWNYLGKTMPQSIKMNNSLLRLNLYMRRPERLTTCSQ